jgi:WD40 repeat protein
LVGEKNSFDYKMPSQKIETGHEDTVHDVAMDYYGKRIATASSDHSIKIIGVNNNTSQHLANLTGHQGPVWQVAWAHPKFGSLLASCSYDGRSQYGRRVIRMTGHRLMFLTITNHLSIPLLGHLMNWGFLWHVVHLMGIYLFLLHVLMATGTHQGLIKLTRLV